MLAARRLRFLPFGTRCSSFATSSLGAAAAAGAARRSSRLSKKDVEKVIPPGDEARHIGEIMPEVLEPEERKEFEDRRVAHELLKYKLHRLSERMKPRLEELEELTVDATGIVYEPEFLSLMNESDLYKFYFINSDDIITFAPGRCGMVSDWADSNKVMPLMIRRPGMMVCEIMRTHPLGKKILVKPRDNLRGIGVGCTLDHAALFSRQMGWLTVIMPYTKRLVQNTEYLQPNSRDPFFFDQPQVARRYLQELIDSQRPILESWVLKEQYSEETHGYDLDDVLNARADDYSPLGLGDPLYLSDSEDDQSDIDGNDKISSGEETDRELEQVPRDGIRMDHFSLLPASEHEFEDMQSIASFADQVEGLISRVNKGELHDEESIFARLKLGSSDAESEFVGDGDKVSPLFETKLVLETLEKSQLTRKFMDGKVSKEELAQEYFTLLGAEVVDDLEPAKRSPTKFRIRRRRVNKSADFIANIVYDSRLHPKFKNTPRRNEEAEAPEIPLTLYDLAIFGLQDESEKLVTNVAVDILTEIRNNDDPSKIATVVINDANWFEGNTHLRHPETFQALPARRLSLQNAFSQFLEVPPKTGFSVLGISPEVAEDKSKWWTTQHDYSIVVDRYSKEEVRNWLLYVCAYNDIDPGVCFGKRKNDVWGQLQAVSGFRGQEFEKYVYYIS